MCTESMIKWNEFYENLDEEIREKRSKLRLVIGEARHAANVIYRREKEGGEKLLAWELVARHIIDDAAAHPELIISNEFHAIAYLIDWYYHRTGILTKQWVDLIYYMEE